MAKLLYQGHGSFRLTTRAGTVIYVDPFAGEGYDKKADMIIVTHEHHDHNHISLVTLKDDGKIIRHADLHPGGEYQTIHFKDITLYGTPAMNDHHDPQECAGFIMDIDGKRIYGAGDTSYFKEMETFEDLDYALLPCDGIYNMDIDEASRVADLIDTKRAIPIHVAPGKLYDEEKVKSFKTKKALFLKPGERIEL